jgi:asparagine synthase (glutamine-hydrolysing)
MVDQLHEVNLQRADRLSMAHSLEVRVPFLDLDLIEAAMALPVRLKRRAGMEKWVLREAVADLLPAEVVRRPKAQFADGTGVTDVLRAAARRRVGSREVEELAARHPRLGITTPEAAWYLGEFLRLHLHLDPERVGRWIGERPAPSPASV